MTKWDEYKKKVEEQRQVRPWDFLNPNTQYASEPEATRRYDLCQSCPEFIKLTSQCKKCGCIMSLKTKLEKATCPIGKW